MAGERFLVTGARGHISFVETSMSFLEEMDETPLVRALGPVPHTPPLRWRGHDHRYIPAGHKGGEIGSPAAISEGWVRWMTDDAEGWGS